MAGWRILALHLLAAIALLCLAVATHAADVTLAWDPVDGATNYTLHWGTSSRAYTSQSSPGPATTRTVTGLAAGTTYYFAVSASDGTGASSGYSNEVFTTTPAAAPVANFTVSTTSGMAPLSVNFTSTSTGTITSHSWTFGDGTTSTSSNPAKTYASAGTYTVSLTVAGPGGGNTKTNTGFITVSPAADTTSPTVPGGLAAVAGGTSIVNLSWTASSDNVGVAGYRVERCEGASCTSFAQVGTPSGTSYSSTGLAAGTTFRFRVRAVDAAGNLSGYSSIASAATGVPPDTTAPGAPGGLAATASGTSVINLSWTASSDNVGVAGYRVERCQGAGCTSFTQVGTPGGTSYGSTGLAADTTYRFRVRAVDAAGNLSAYSSIASATTESAADTTAPSVPGALGATANGTSTVNLSWTASTDNVGVAGYRVERCEGAACTSFAQVGTPSGTSYSSTGLAAGTTYRFRVRAVDAAGNLSAYSSIASATTESAADTTAPSVPGALGATANGTSTINLSWTASTDNVGVAGYRVERCEGAACTSFVQVGTPTGPSFSSSGLAPGTTYRFRVRAADAAGNLSGYSSVVAAATAVAAPVASFSATPRTGAAPLVVGFTSTSTGSISSYSWSFGDGTTSTAQNPSKTYAAPGSYTVSLTVTGAGGSHSATQTGYITAAAPPLAMEDRGVLMDASSASGTNSNRNGIIEPGESVRIVPIWGALSGGEANLTASARVSGPSGATYTLNDSAARYGMVNAGEEVDCETATGNCYRLTVSNPSVRPALRWVVQLTETLSTGAVHTRELHIGRSFPDVPVTDIMYSYVEALVHHKVTLGNQGRFAPTDNAMRVQTAMFVARAHIAGDGDDDIPASGMVPAGAYNCVAGGTSRFADLSPTDVGCKQMHYLAARGINIAHGCTANNRVCPTAAASRAVMAVYVAGAIATGGDAGVPVAGTFSDTGSPRSYNCATTGGGHFPDVPSSAAYCRHVNYLWARGIIDGFLDGTFQPGGSVSRSQMAKFIANGFALHVDGR